MVMVEGSCVLIVTNVIYKIKELSVFNTIELTNKSCENKLILKFFKKGLIHCT
jgi:hypothetical protein